MFKFSYKSVNKNKKIQEGSLWAMSKKHAQKKIADRGEIVVVVYRREFSILPQKLLAISFGISKYERIIFFRNLAAMVSSGLSIVSALEVLETQVRSAKVKKAIETMARNVADGAPLSQATKAFPQYFAPYIVETIKLGEITGTLHETLDRISVDLEKDYQLSRKVTQALAYPVIILVVMLVLLVVLVVFVLPKIVQLFHELNTPLPLLTQVLYNVGNVLTQHTILATLAVALIFGLFYFLLKLKKGRYIAHYILLGTPIIGKIIKEFNLVKFFRALETLVSCGISWIEGVEVAKKTLGNELYKEAVETVHPILLHGGTLSQALTPFPSLFPLQTIRTLAVGEQTGRFEDTLRNVSIYFERSLDHTTQIMTALIEPILMLVIGVVVGALALSIFVPIYQISSII